MDKSFNDTGINFNDASVVWHCKKKRFYNEVFRKEYLEYLKMVKGEYKNNEIIK